MHIAYISVYKHCVFSGCYLYNYHGRGPAIQGEEMELFVSPNAIKPLDVGAARTVIYNCASLNSFLSAVHHFVLGHDSAL